MNKVTDVNLIIGVSIIMSVSIVTGISLVPGKSPIMNAKSNKNCEVVSVYLVTNVELLIHTSKASLDSDDGHNQIHNPPYIKRRRGSAKRH